VRIRHVPKVQTVHTAGSWSNPFGGDGDFQSDLLDGGGGAGKPEVPAEPAAGGDLLNGDYDEAAEAEAFKAAVAQWRVPASAAGSKDSGASGTSTGNLESSSKVAANLAKQMEADFSARKAELCLSREKAQEEMQERLRVKERELEVMYAEKEEEEGGEEEEKWGGEEKGGEEEEKRGEEAKGGGCDSEEEIAPASEPKTAVAVASPSKPVGVEVLETTVYSPGAKGSCGDDESDGGGVVVEEGTSSEEEEE